MLLHLKTIALVAFVSATPSASASNPSGAVAFQMPGTQYFVSMPGVPECKNRLVATPSGPTAWHFCAYFDSQVGRGYSIEYVVLPKAPSKEQSLLVLRAAAAGAAANSKSDVVSEEVLSISGHPSLECILVTREKGFVAKARYILIGNNLITVTVDGGPKVKDSPDTKAFLNSLRIPTRSAPNNSLEPNALRSTNHAAG